MNCGRHFLNLNSGLTQDRITQIKTNVSQYFLNLQKKPKAMSNLQSINVADKIFFNGTIYTMEEEHSTAEAIATYGDRILFVGSQFQASMFKGQKTQIIDLQGKTLLPGFIDSHFHLQIQAFKGFTDLSAFNFSHEDDIKKFMIKTINESTQIWVPFQLYGPMITQGDMPHLKDDLDLLSTQKAIFLLQANGHIAYANSKAFEIAGIDYDTPDPPLGTYGRDQVTKQLTGVINEKAILSFIQYIPKVTEQQYKDNVIQAGVTTVHDCGIGGFDPFIELNFITSSFGPECKIRLSGMYLYDFWNTWKEMEVKPEFNDPQLRLNGMKFVCDGTTQGGSAFLTKPYLKQEWGCGVYNMNQQQLDAGVLHSHSENFRVGIHANGDGAIDMALNSFQKARQLKLNHHLRLRIQHSTVSRQDQLQRMYKLGVSPTFLIGHVYFYGKAFLEQILGQQRALKLDPVKSAYRNKLKPTLHSDYNCQPIGPIRYMHNAITRIMKYHQTNQVLGKDECITVYEALKAVTINAAWQCHMDDIVGSLVIGKCADFVILDQDPYKVNPADIINIGISQTWKGGIKRFSK